MNHKLFEECFMDLACNYIPDDCDLPSFALIEIKASAGIAVVQFNMNESDDFMPQLFVSCMVDLEAITGESADEMERARHAFAIAVKYRETHLLKFFNNIKRLEETLE
jgi:hypothetical protein